MRGQGHDVVIIGGGSVGCATALHLLLAEPGMNVLVLEPDPTYAAAATTRASGGVRQLFTRPENILLSRYTHEIVGRWPAFLGLDNPPDLGWRQNGYLFIAARDHAAVLERNLAVQRAHGVAAEWLEPADLADRFPYLETRDLGPGVLSARDGWLDPHALLHGMRAAARLRGARFRTDRATTIELTGTRVTGVGLASGRRLAADVVVNAAGIGAPDLAAQAGMPVPVEPMPRFEHFVETPGEFGSMPFIKDPSGLAMRPEGAGLSVGLVDFDRPASTELPHEPDHFDTRVWPALARRVPTLDRLRLRSTWAGHYDQNRLDGNMVIGNRPGRVDNLYLATGFSGHGLMHAPGVGRALTELILHGRYTTIDLTSLGYQRIANNTPYPELAIR